MSKTDKRARMIYLLAFLGLVGIEVLIALFAHDRFIRPFVGDVLIMAVMYCFMRILLPHKVKLLPLYLFLFAVAVEIGQYFHFVSLLGLGNSKFFRILLGTTFAYADILCYAVGSVRCGVAEYVAYLHKQKGIVMGEKTQ